MRTTNSVVRTTFRRARGLGLVERIAESIETAGEWTVRRNEQVFPVGVSPAQIKAIVCPTERGRDEVLEILREAGIDHLNGESIERRIIVGLSFDEVLAALPKG